MEFLAQKIGMSRSLSIPSYAVTLVKIIDTKVCDVKDGNALVSYSKGKKINNSIIGNQKKYNLPKEFNRFKTLKVSSDDNLENIDYSLLVSGKSVKSSFTTKGRGFTGVVKRWNFAGAPSSHGHRMGRRTGSIGNAEFPGRVQKGRKMPGHYGVDKVSVTNKIVSFNTDSMILVLQGSIAGANGNYGIVRVK